MVRRVKLAGGVAVGAVQLTFAGDGSSPLAAVWREGLVRIQSEDRSAQTGVHPLFVVPAKAGIQAICGFRQGMPE